MPEPDTYDLDAAFARLEQDITSLSTAPGAGAAVARARRRRRTTIGAVAAVAVLVTGGVVLGHGLSTRDDVAAPADQLPAPAPLDGPRLTAATAGWTPVWTQPSRQSQLGLQQSFGGSCLPALPGGQGRGGIVVLGNSHADVALAVMGEYGSDSAAAQEAWQRVEHKLATCRGAELVSSFSDPSGADGHTYRIAATPSESAPEYEWIVSTGRAVGVLKVFGQSDLLPTANDRPVADALLAAVRAPESYANSGSAPDRAVGYSQVSDAAFAEAVGGWATGWKQRTGRTSTDATPPCRVLDSLVGMIQGSGRSLGVNGNEELYLFDDAADAATSASAMASALRGCTEGSYVVRTVPTPRGATVTVASGAGAGGSVIWIVQGGPGVGYVQVPAGETPPPDSVSAAIGDLLASTLAHPRHGAAPQSTSSAPASAR